MKLPNFSRSFALEDSSAEYCWTWIVVWYTSRNPSSECSSNSPTTSGQTSGFRVPTARDKMRKSSVERLASFLEFATARAQATFVSCRALKRSMNSSLSVCRATPASKVSGTGTPRDAKAQMRLDSSRGPNDWIRCSSSSRLAMAAMRASSRIAREPKAQAVSASSCAVKAATSPSLRTRSPIPSIILRCFTPRVAKDHNRLTSSCWLYVVRILSLTIFSARPVISLSLRVPVAARAQAMLTIARGLKAARTSSLAAWDPRVSRSSGLDTLRVANDQARLLIPWAPSLAASSGREANCLAMDSISDGRRMPRTAYDQASAARSWAGAARRFPCRASAMVRIRSPFRLPSCPYAQASRVSSRGCRRTAKDSSRNLCESEFMRPSSVTPRVATAQAMSTTSPEVNWVIAGRETPAPPLYVRSARAFISGASRTCILASPRAI
mmetsp:Transcript_29038/g.52158  ORF Transcript_29038/g.52158 Transcript_29038/m.52158 type:complete len:440 (-) Transcript_29038:853-2172(-)